MALCQRGHFFQPQPRLRSRGVGRYYSSSSRQATDIPSILSKPTWSVRSLLPSSSRVAGATQVTPKELKHLLRLSALPAPRSQEEEAQMLNTLNSQLHFVREIQKLKTHSVAPLKSIRDESAEADLEREIGYEELKGALKGGHPSRKYSAASRNGIGTPEAPKELEEWDVLKQAERRAGQYFIVETGKK
ncbi:MAG: hypothetical protein M1840_004789 [Geoglossum simile]|nr:MAG: hypothetical protein M1840_004789 [Geoglossum simile]